MPQWKNINDIIKFLKIVIESYDEICMVEQSTVVDTILYPNGIKLIPKGLYENVYVENITHTTIVTDNYVYRHNKCEKIIKKRFLKYKEIVNNDIIKILNLYFAVLHRNMSMVLLPNIILSTIFDYLTSKQLYSNQVKTLRKTINKSTKINIYVVTNFDLIKLLYDELIQLNNNVEVDSDVIMKQIKKKRKKITSAVVEYMGDIDIIPYTLQIPVNLCNENELDILSLNLPIKNSRNFKKYCVLGWLDQYINKFNIDISNDELVLNNFKTNIILNYNTIIQNINLLYEFITNIYLYNELCVDNNTLVYNIMNIVNNTNIINVFWRYNVIKVIFSDLWKYLENKNERTINKTISRIINIINMYCEFKTIIIVLFDNNSIQNISSKTISNIEKVLMEIKKYKYIKIDVISLLGDQPDIHNKCELFLKQYCYPNLESKTDKFLNYKFKGSIINHICKFKIKNYELVLNNINELKNKINLIIYNKYFKRFPEIIKTHKIYEIKYSPCLTCKKVIKINEKNIIQIHNKKFIKCHNCKHKLCTVCLKEHDCFECSNTTVKKQLYKFIGEQTKWYNGSVPIIGLSKDAVDEMISNSFDKTKPMCFCQSCLANNILTYLESDRIACNHVFCPICTWDGCFMCGKKINKLDYCDTHLVSMGNSDFMIKLNRIVDEKYRCEDPVTWRCYISVCSMFISDNFKFVDILWILYNLALVMNNPTYMWKNVCKRVLPMLFATNNIEINKVGLQFIEKCKKCTSFSEFQGTIIEAGNICKYNDVNCVYNDTIINESLYRIWTDLFKPYNDNKVRFYASIKLMKY